MKKAELASTKNGPGASAEGARADETAGRPERERFLPGGKYEILESAGKGGAGEVFRVYDRRLAKIWAAKRVKKNCPGMEELVLGKVDIGWFPRIVDAVEDRECTYLVMDWIEGETLQTRLEREGAFAPEEAVRIGIELCSAIGALHRMQPPLLYLDCKPSNIMLDKEGRLWLTDFGSALEICGDAAEPFSGSLGYAAPEQFGFYMGGKREKVHYSAGAEAAGKGRAEAKRRRADERSDIFGLGRTLYALLGGMDPSKPPYAACSLRECSPAVPNRLVKIVEKCMKTAPRERYGTMEAVRNALMAFEKEEKQRRWKALLLSGGTWILLGLLLQRAWIFYRQVTGLGAEMSEKMLSLFGIVAFAAAAQLWQRLVVERNCRLGRGLEAEPLQSVFRTEKKAGRWLFAWLVSICILAPVRENMPAEAAALQITSEWNGSDEGKRRRMGASQAPEEENGTGRLPLVLRDEKMRKLLVKEGCALRSEKPVFLEFDPALFETDQELEIYVTAAAKEGGDVWEYRFLYAPAENGGGE